MKDRREQIINKALYYYFKDQDELFYTCMEKFFLEPKQRALSNVSENTGIDLMIKVMLDYLHNLEEALLTFDTKTINTSNVNDLMFTAYSKFPSLHRKAQRLALKELELWRKAIYNDQRAGLIRRDIDREQIAIMFTHIKNSYDSGLGQTQMDFSLLEKTYSEFHHLLKL